MKDNIIISRFVKHKNRQYINFNME